MIAETLKKFVERHPFRPFRIRLHAGDPIDIRHPESIHVGREWAAVWQDPDLPIFFETDMIVSIEFFRKGGARRRP